MSKPFKLNFSDKKFLYYKLILTALEFLLLKEYDFKKKKKIENLAKTRKINAIKCKSFQRKSMNR